MNASVLIVPGLRDQVANHWQTLLASRMPRAETVAPMGRENIDLDGRVAAIEAAAQRIGGPLIIVAHSAGCIMTAHWAKRTHCQAIGALLAAPPDLEPKQIFALENAAEAHRALESRSTRGATVLIP